MVSFIATPNNNTILPPVLMNSQVRMIETVSVKAKINRAMRGLRQ
jgi:hypothetical protein